MNLPVNKILCGDAKEVMAQWPDESINCSISSPPYWALRDYGTAIWEGSDPNCDHKQHRKPRSERPNRTGSGIGKGGPTFEAQENAYYKNICKKCGAKRIDKQLGLEKTFEEYIDKLCGIYDEVKRVLRKDGTCFVNLGDTYWGGKGQSGRCDHNIEQRIAEGRTFQRREYTLPTKHCPQDGKHEFVQDKSLCLIPQRFAIEMINRGWILRNVIVWHKPNPMPSSAKDRFTVDFEYVFFFVKSKRYWFEPQYEPHASTYEQFESAAKSLREQRHSYNADNAQFVQSGGHEKQFINPPNPLGRNKRTVWTIPTQAYPDAHFATFPEKLVEPMIKAGCPEFVCKKCGKARVKIYDTSYELAGGKGQEKYGDNTPDDGSNPGPQSMKHGRANAPHYFKGYTDCGCNAGWRPGIVLDLFRRQRNRRQGRRPIAA